MKKNIFFMFLKQSIAKMASILGESGAALGSIFSRGVRGAAAVGGTSAAVAGMMRGVNRDRAQIQQEQERINRQLNFSQLQNAINNPGIQTQPETEQMAPMPRTDFPNRGGKISDSATSSQTKKTYTKKQKNKENLQPDPKHPALPSRATQSVEISEIEYRTAYASQSLESLRDLEQQIMKVEESKDPVDQANIQRELSVVRRLIVEKQAPQQTQQIEHIQQQAVHSEEVKQPEANPNDATHFEFQPMGQADENIDIKVADIRESDKAKGHGGPNDPDPPGDDGPGDGAPNNNMAGNIGRLANRAVQGWQMLQPVVEGYQNYKKAQDEKTRQEFIDKLMALPPDELDKIHKNINLLDEYSIQSSLLAKR